MKSWAWTWRPPRYVPQAAALLIVLVGCGWEVSAGHATRVFALIVVLAVIALAIYERGAMIGLFVLVAMNGLPFFSTTQPIASHFTVEDLAAFGLIGCACAWTLTADKSERPTRTARMVSGCGIALLSWCVITVARGEAPLLGSIQFGIDFFSFGALLIVLPRVRLRPRDLHMLLAVLVVGACLFAVGQIVTALGLGNPTWLIHAGLTANTLGLTRVYAPMTDLVFAGAAFGVATIVLGRGRRAHSIAVPLTILFSTSVIVQLTRARWITLILSIVIVSVWFALQGERRVARRLRRRLAVLIGLMVGGAVMTSLIAPGAIAGGPVVQRFLSIFTDVGSANTATNNVAIRQHVASSMLDVLGGKWLVGLGLIPTKTHYFASLPGGSLRDSDVGVLNAVMTMGVIGAALIFLPLVLVLVRCMRAARTRAAESQPALLYGGQIWIIGALASSLTLVTLFSKSGVVLAATIIAVLCQPSVVGVDDGPVHGGTAERSPPMEPAVENALSR